MRYHFSCVVMVAVVALWSQPKTSFAASFQVAQSERTKPTGSKFGGQDNSGYPNKPIRIVVPQTAGSSTDFFARAIGEGLHERLRVPIVVDNRPGAGGRIGLEIVATAAPDGYTLTLTTEGSLTIAPHLYHGLPYDPLKDFAPVTRVAAAPYVLVVNSSVPAKSVKELIALAKAKPGSINFGSGGNGTGTHLSGELFKLMADVGIVHVPYKGGSPALTDTVGGRVQMLFVGLPPALPQIYAGRLRPLGVTTRVRSSLLPNVPTVSEGGLAGYEVEPWWGIFAPTGMSRLRLSKLYTEIAENLKQPGFREKLASHGAEALGDSPAQVQSVVKAGFDKWAKVIKSANVHLD